MAMSTEDATADSLRSKRDIPDSNVEISRVTTVSTARRPPKDRCEPGYDLDGKNELTRYRCVARFIHAGMALAVIDRMRHHLQKTARRPNLLTAEHAGCYESESDLPYLVRDKDIVDSLSLAFAELEHAEDTGPRKRVSAPSCRVLSSRPSLPKLNSQCNIITPCLSAAADPVTTISVPKTSFSTLRRANSQDDVDIGCTDVSARATVISRRSATEIVWRGNEARDGLLAQKRDSGTDPKTVCKDGSPRLAETSAANGLAWDDAAADGGAWASLADRHVDMTSFPELQPRHCTNEWLKPPAEMEQLTKVTPPDFYSMGVDAHGGDGGAPNTSALGGGSQQPEANPLRYDGTLFGECAFSSDGNNWRVDRLPARRPSSLASDKRWGAWIGSASHRRRSTQAADTRGWQDESDTKSLLSHFLDRLRWSGQRTAQRHDDSPTPPPTSRGSSTQEMRSAGARCGTCSEDNRPHVCEDDLDLQSSEAVSIA